MVGPARPWESLVEQACLLPRARLVLRVRSELRVCLVPRVYSMLLVCSMLREYPMLGALL